MPRPARGPGARRQGHRRGDRNRRRRQTDHHQDRRGSRDESRVAGKHQLSACAARRKDLKNAAKIALGDLAVGDRVLARGKAGADAASLTATSIVVMTQADLAKKHEADHAEWKKRGVSGVITALNPESKEITISVRNREGLKPLVIPASGAVDLRRYAPDSVLFSEAKPSAFAELKVGDQVRALGTKSEDGTRLTPEFIVAGAFRNIAATVISLRCGGEDDQDHRSRYEKASARSHRSGFPR